MGIFQLRNLIVILVWISVYRAAALFPYSGDINSDQRLDIADVTKMTNINHTTATLAGEPLIFADANQDGIFDATDTQYLVNVLLGLAVPKPLAGPGQAAFASYWKIP